MRRFSQRSALLAVVCSLLVFFADGETSTFESKFSHKKGSVLYMLRDKGMQKRHILTAAGHTWDHADGGHHLPTLALVLSFTAFRRVVP
jgi:hypothetical protein